MSRYRLIVAGVLFGAIFVSDGFQDGWDVAIRRGVGFSYGLTVMVLMMAVVLTTSLRDFKTDRSIWLLSALTVLLGVAHYFMLSARSLHYVSLLGAGCGAIIGLGLRFCMTEVGQRLERKERQFFRWLFRRDGK